MNPTEFIVHNLTASKMLMRRYLEDFSPQEYLHRACPNGNCAAWILGHLILTERRALGGLGVAELPELPAGFEGRFGREGDAWKAEDFGDVTILVPLFNQHRDRTLKAVKSATPELLAKPVERPLPVFKTVGESINFMGMHTSFHLGQITMIRRSLGRAPIV